jgi:HEAT repeat protein
MIAMWYLSKEDAVKHVLDSLDSDVPKIRKTAKQFLKSSKMPVVLFEMKEKLKSDNLDIQLFALDAIYGYGGWQALEGIMYAITNEQDAVLDKAKNLLDSWLIRSASLYSKPDGATGSKIAELFEAIRNKGLISSNAFRQLQFVIETRR